jgi:hypothetical protein
MFNVKAGRVDLGARKVYRGRRVGQACTTRCQTYKTTILIPQYPSVKLHGVTSQILISVTTSKRSLSVHFNSVSS